jgi:ParB family chromosome partitioning protein
MGHARALLSLDRATQITAANQIAAKKMPVREAEGLVKKLVPSSHHSRKSQQGKSVTPACRGRAGRPVDGRGRSADQRVSTPRPPRRHGEIAIQLSSLTS